MSKKIPLLAGVLLAAFLLPLGSFAQSVIVGRILSKIDQSPIPGATVGVKGTRIGTASGIDGGFAIRAKEGDVLVISGIGIIRMEQVVSGNSLVIAVATDSRELNQVVVTATGIRKEAKRLGYAIQTVDASQLTTSREADPINSLKGEGAGLQININSEVGHSPDVIMRGENDISDRPLFVVDGVPISSDTYNVNPDDIESFSLLKGPNAAALYGFQGKNGAIIIITKKGTKDKRGLAVTLNSTTQVSKGFIALPKYQDLFGPGDNGKYAFGGGGSSPQSYFGNGAVGVGINDYDYDVWGPQFRGQLLPQYDGVYDASQQYITTFADGSTYKGHVAPTPWTARGANNLKNFLQTGVLSANSLSITSSTEKTDFRISAGNTYQQGIVPNTKMNNANFTISLIHRVNDRFSISSYFNYSRQS